MHHIYHTNAFILESRPKGEGNKFITLYTRELGLVFAMAQSVRELRSKVRYAVQDFSLAKVDLVKGKEVWRVTSATPVLNIASRNVHSMRLIARVFSLVQKLCAGEEANEILFDDLKSFYEGVLDVDSKEKREQLELITVVRILHHLGYLGKDEDTSAIISGGLSVSLWGNSDFERALLVKKINTALKETQLM